MTPREQFDTGVEGWLGVWPEPPEWQNYSSVKETERCPRRWALKHASYPNVWEEPRFPERPSLPSLLGDVMHAALERILNVLVERNCPSAASACAVEALRELGGFTAVLSDATTARIDGLRANPRARVDLVALETEVRRRFP